MNSTNEGPEQIFLANLPLIDRILKAVVLRSALSEGDAEDFASWAKTRLLDNDYAIIRKFAGRSSLKTYLVIVLSNLSRDFRNERWGRWRPSAAATRLGPVAIRLEELLYRDGAPLHEAIAILQSGTVTLTDRELSSIATKLPRRSPVTEVSLDETDLDDATMVAHQDTNDFEGATQAVGGALQSLVSALPDEERYLLLMRFWHNMSVADIARVMQVEQKPLYRRLDGIQVRLREALEAGGIDKETAHDVLGGGFH
ncbi:MAG: sigma-70 family RNA polymerase sigma factor [Gemmatimonadaceae bacterium]